MQRKMLAKELKNNGVVSTSEVLDVKNREKGKITKALRKEKRKQRKRVSFCEASLATE